ncbi:TMEM175 family protein [Algoriphagus yeomjeoni]|uniref:Putative membrane protein n=1 Tax=Algoriphagus yeomjeoni TaxID=291403 RepID=A0A327PCZ5_9BACT|nr:TMEM175 family protein [Algoriphagus yeomjeoni]RAI89321.1 putative membrane protein [Algoriphagus yeomjeoni]
MNKNRLEAFSDGVLAIVITIMVLEIKFPSGDEWTDLQPLIPVFLSYTLSFIYIGIYWNNHHHMLHTVTKVNGKLMWANLHLLFWLSLIPFTTGWVGENSFAAFPMAVYGIILLMSAIAYFILQRLILHSQGPDSILAKALGKDLKGKLSPIMYLLAIGASWIDPAISGAIYLFVALMWLIPDLRIEKMIIAETD